MSAEGQGRGQRGGKGKGGGRGERRNADGKKEGGRQGEEGRGSNFPKMPEPEETKQIEKLFDQKNALRDEITKLNASIEGLQKSSNSGAKAKTDLRNETKEISKLLQGLFTEKKKCQQERQAIQETIKKSKAELQAARSKLPVRRSEISDAELIKLNNAHFQKEIDALENRMSTESLSLKQEKDIHHRIKSVKMSRVVVANFEAQLGQTVNNPQLAKLKEKIEKFDKEIDTLKAKEKLKVEELNKIKEKSSGVQTTIKEHIAKRKEKSALMTKLTKDINDLKAVRETKRKEWNKKQQELIKAHREAEHKKYLARQEARKQRQAQKEEEQAKIVPYEDEIYTCDQLVGFLEKLEKNKNKKKMNHDINTFRLFDSISLVPPCAAGDIASSITAVKEKKEHYKGLQVVAVEKKKKALEDKKAKEAADAAAAAEAPKEDAAKADESAAPSEETPAPAATEEAKAADESPKEEEAEKKEEEAAPAAAETSTEQTPAVEETKEEEKTEEPAAEEPKADAEEAAAEPKNEDDTAAAAPSEN